MRLLTGGVAHVAEAIEKDLINRKCNIHKPHIKGLADLSACVLTCRSANTAEWQAILPRSQCSEKAKEHYVSRLLANNLIEPLEVISGFVREILEGAGSHGKVVVLMLDQSKIAKEFECLMASLRVGERAIPIGWCVIKTKGEIGFDIQKALLDKVALMIPKGITVLLAADRFYGTSSLVNWCKAHNWQYRIRLKGNLIFHHEGGEITPNDTIKAKITALESATFNNTEVTTNIGILHEDGHPEPWIIAMDCKPSEHKVLDYSMRWGIECMFSDFKSRGFCITKTQLNHADRIERMILILAIALYWAVSTGMGPTNIKTESFKKSLQINNFVL
jgi:hypothetical protein